MSLGAKEIHKILAKKLQHEDFKLEDFEWKHVPGINGMMGDNLKLKCHVYDHRVRERSVHSFFVKMKLQWEVMNNLSEKIFRKETKTYEAFQRMNMPMVNDSLANCYYADDVHLVFADLSTECYEIQTTQRLTTFDEMVVILKSLAAIHAGAIIYEEQRGRQSGKTFSLFEEFPDAFVELYMSENIDSVVKEYYKAFLKGVVTAIDVFDMPKILKNGKVFQNELERFWSLYPLIPSKKFRNSVCQCDLSSSNIFIKRSKDGEPLHARIIDYQVTRYLPPALDVLDVLLLNTSREFRQTNMKHLLQEYFKYFCDNLKEYDIEPENIYTYEEFLASIKEMEFLAIITECLSVPISSMDKEKFAAWMKDSEEKTKILCEDRSPLMTRFKDDEYYMSRVKDTILDLMNYFDNN